MVQHPSEANYLQMMYLLIPESPSLQNYALKSLLFVPKVLLTDPLF